MRVLAIGNLYPPAATGGYERIWAATMAALSAAGHETRVLTTATMLAVGRGQFAEAFSYVAVLLGVMAIAAGAALVLQRRWA